MNEVTFEIKESMLSGTFDVLIDGKVIAEMLDEQDAKLFLNLAQALSSKNDEISAQARRITVLKSELEQVVNCVEPCANCDETGNDPGTLDACEVCGSYGFNVKGDIREVVLSIRAMLEKG